VQSAETIRLAVGGLLVLPVSVDALKTFAEPGEITGDLKLVMRFLDAETLALVRGGLNQPLPLNASTGSHLAYSPLGQDI
jgi:hypothetical protein